MLRAFQVVAPTTPAEAVAELAQWGEGGKVYAGGAELVLLLRHGLVEADCLVDVKQVPDLQGITANGAVVRIGAAVTHRQLETEATIRNRLPALARAETQVGNIRVRCQGTLGGNLCFADPHADPPTALLVYEATVGIYGKAGPRRLRLDEFLVGTYETALEPEELLTDIEVPTLAADWNVSFQRIERFHRPTANVAMAAQLRDGHIGDLRLVAGCVGPRALRLSELEETCRGLAVQEAQRALAGAGPYLRSILDPVDDLLGSADYKLRITSVLLQRALDEACTPAAGGSHG